MYYLPYAYIPWVKLGSPILHFDGILLVKKKKKFQWFSPSDSELSKLFFGIIHV